MRTLTIDGYEICAEAVHTQHYDSTHIDSNIRILEIDGYKIPDIPQARIACSYKVYISMSSLVRRMIKKNNIGLQKLLFIAKAQA